MGHLVAQDLAAHEGLELALGRAELVAHEDVVLAGVEAAVLAVPVLPENTGDPHDAGGQLGVADTEAAGGGVAGHQHGCDELGHHLGALGRGHAVGEGGQPDQLIGDAGEQHAAALVAVGGLQLVDTGRARRRRIGTELQGQVEVGGVDRLAVDLDHRPHRLGTRATGDRPTRGVEGEDEGQDDDAENRPNRPGFGLVAKGLEHVGLRLGIARGRRRGARAAHYAAEVPMGQRGLPAGGRFALSGDGATSTTRRTAPARRRSRRAAGPA